MGTLNKVVNKRREKLRDLHTVILGVFRECLVVYVADPLGDVLLDARFS